MSIFTSRIFTRRLIIALVLGFVVVVLLSNMAVRYACSVVSFDCPEAWPISLFFPQIPVAWQVGLALALGIGFFPVARLLDQRGYRLREVLLVALVTVALTNLLSGVELGYNEPMTHRDQQYYSEAVEIENPLVFLRDFNTIQPTLGMHGQTHPPGAILTIYVLERLLRLPELISLALGLIAMTASVFFVYRIFMIAFDDDRQWAGYGALLFAVLPAIQIYYIATIDALVTALLTGVLYAFLVPEKHDGRRAWWLSTIGAALGLFYALMINIPAVAILPVLFGYQLFYQRRLLMGRAFLVTALAFALIAALYLVFGFDYYAAFRHAENFENNGGFALIDAPVNYLFTRLECVAEILFFFGPFLLYLGLKGWPVLWRDYRREAILLALLVLTLLAMFLVGTYRTGETARPLAFAYVYLLFPVLAYLRHTAADAQARVSLLMLVFSQVVYMQLLGIYLW